MKTLYDPKTGTLVLCVLPAEDPPRFVMIAVEEFFRQAGTACCINVVNSDEFWAADTSVVDTADWCAGLYTKERTVTASEIISETQFSFDSAIDVTGYSLERLERVIMDSVDALIAAFDKLTKTNQGEQ